MFTKSGELSLRELEMDNFIFSRDGLSSIAINLAFKSFELTFILAEFS